jgi:glycosyltransferase involved in cell wall biosynthesis
VPHHKETENIWFDARWLGDNGIGRFAAELLARLGPFRELSAPLKPTHPLDVLYLSCRMLAARFPAWYSPGYNAPLVALSRYVFTVHDLNHLDLAANSGFLKRLYYRVVLRRACRRAARVLTVSEFSRGRIIQWSGVAPSQVVNVGNGVSAPFGPSGAAYRPGYRYLFCVGNRKSHKNELRLLQAFGAAPIDPAIRLLFSGWASPELSAQVRDLGLAERVHFLGRLEDEALAEIYRGAVALVFPSLYEGFGLPVLEAMACGTPVLTSNQTALPEVAGDAALLVDPLDCASIACGIGRVVNDVELAKELAARGLRRVEFFSWDAVAEKVRCVLLEVLQEKGGKR